MENEKRCNSINYFGIKCNKLLNNIGPLCRYHYRIISGLEIKSSNIKNAGIGLFATRNFNQGERLDEYKGRIINCNINDLISNSKYILSVTDDIHIDCEEKTSCIGRYANDGRNPIINNCTFVEENGKIYIESTRIILMGEEIYVDYGENYW